MVINLLGTACGLLLEQFAVGTMANPIKARGELISRTEERNEQLIAVCKAVAY